MSVSEFNGSTVVEVSRFIDAKSRRLLHDRELDRLRLYYSINVHLSERLKDPKSLYVLPGEVVEEQEEDNEEDINYIFENLL